MATDVIITGTGFPVPDPKRAGPGVLIRVGDLNLQFDAGRSTVRRIDGNAETSHPNTQESCTTSFGLDVGERLDLCPARETVDDGQQVPHPT